MKADQVAMVIGKTIHLHNTRRQQFLHNDRWVRHEVAHVYQWIQFGHINFIIKYLTESLKHGYYNNSFEIEARGRESDLNILDNILFL